MTITSRYDGTCGSCGNRFKAGTKIAWVRGFKATHLPGACTEAEVVAPKVDGPKVDGSAIVAFLDIAKANGLKYPKARFLAPEGGELRLSVSGERSRVPGSVQVVIDEQWIGRIEPDGTVYGPLERDESTLAALDAIASDPATKAKEYGALMGRCSFCFLELTDAGSVEVGYGPVCAKRWHLPHKPKGTPALKAVA